MTEATLLLKDATANNSAIRPQMFVGTEPRLERLAPVRNGDGDYTLLVKATGGMWTSSYRDGDDAWLHADSAWLSRLASNITATYVASHPNIAVWRCIPKETCRIWRIDTVSDLAQLLAEYGRRVHINQHATPRDWLLQQLWMKDRIRAHLPKLHHLPKLASVPDFERLAATGWDAVWLTHAGYLATRYGQPHLYGWDCECVFWLGGNDWPFSACEIDRPVVIQEDYP